ncbi:major antigen [Haematococcus lacustris]|uniref:Major antigen n=1 Tax=Haematococcus lacustris TaxID=44745 RepID=A0A699YXN9_HAELA|nr:major antigen [Haematococcus lacustris]
MDTTEPAPGPAPPGAAPGKQGAAVRGRVPGPNMGSMPAKQRPGLAFKLPAAGNATLTGSGTPLMKLGSTDPGATPLMAGTKASARTPNAMLSAKKTMAGPTLTASSPAMVPRPLQQAQQPGTANPLSKTPCVNSRVPAAPACPSTPPPQQAPCTPAGPAATAANSTEGTMDISPVAGLGRMDLSSHSPAGYQIAVAPGMPASWNTPLAQMQALPMDFALHAPLVDASPFDEGLNTEYITHEAKRLMDNLADSQVNDVKRVLHPPTPGAAADFSFATGFGSAANTTTSPPLRGLRPDMCSPSVPASPSFPGSRQPTPSAMDTPTTDLLGLSMSGSLTQNAGMAAVPAAAGSSCTGSSLLEMQNSAMLNMLSSEEDMERQARQAAEEQLQVAHTQMAVLQDSVRTMQASNTELQQQLAASQEQSTSLAAQLASTRDEVAAARAQHASALAQVEPLQAQLRSVMVERDNLKNSCVELVGKVSAAEKDTARLRQARNEAQSSLKQSTDQLVAEQLHRRQQEVDMAKQAAEKISLQTSLSKLTQEREMMRKEVSELQTTLASCQKQHVADVTKLKQENAELMKMAEELMGALEKERSKRKFLGQAVLKCVGAVGAV